MDINNSKDVPCIHFIRNNPVHHQHETKTQKYSCIKDLLKSMQWTGNDLVDQFLATAKSASNKRSNEESVDKRRGDDRDRSDRKRRRD